MVQRCSACGFAADTMVTLPEPWKTYLVTECGFSTQDQTVTLPVCVGCQRTMEQFLDPKHPTGGTDPDTAVHSFLNDITHPRQLTVLDRT
jgi:hypothetical protein